MEFVTIAGTFNRLPIRRQTMRFRFVRNIQTIQDQQRMAVVFAVAILSMFVGCEIQQPIPAVHAEPVVLNVNVMKAQLTEDATQTVVCYGMLVPTRQASLSFGRGGVVANVLKQVGDRVAEGDVLANLEQQQLLNEQQTAQLALERATAESPRQPNAQAKSRIAALQQQRNALNLEVQKGQLTATFSGIVAKSNIEMGSGVSPATTAVVIAADEPPIAKVNLDTETAAKILPNQPLWVGRDDTAILAKLQNRSARPGRPNSEQLVLEFEQPIAADKWSYEEVVEIRFRLVTDDSGYWLPMSALQQAANGEWSLLVAEPTSAERATTPNEQKAASKQTAILMVTKRECEIVRHDGDQVLVNNVALTDALIIEDGSHRIVPGQIVQAARPRGISTATSKPTAEEGVE